MKLLIGGSPCTYWSIAQSKNRETEASGIGWELFLNYAISRDVFKPDYFLYENNKSMSNAIRQQITRMLGVEPVYINSALVSAQNRARLYWIGKRNAAGGYDPIPVEQPEDRGILLRDVLESGVCWREKAYTLRASAGTKQGVSNILRHIETNGRFGYQGVAEPLITTPDGKSFCITAMEYKGSNAQQTLTKHRRTMAAEPVGVGFRNRRENDGKLYRRFETHGEPKSNAPTTVQTDSMVAEPIKPLSEREMDYMVRETSGGRNHFDFEYFHDGNRDKSACLTANLSRGVPYNVICDPVRVGTIESSAKNADFDSQRYRVYSPDGKSVTLCGNGGGVGAKTGLYAVPTDGKTLPVYEVRDGRITIKGKQYPIKLRDGCYIIRKLTVTECMRLQTVPEWYVFPVSDSQAYKMLGNGWTVEVIMHLMRHFDGITTEPLDVLSMYDGMACGHIALDKLGANVRNYYATEIDKYAIKTATHNFPDIVELGDAFNIRWDEEAENVG